MRYISNVLVSVILGFSLTFIYAFSASKIASASAEELLRNVKTKFIVNNVDAKKNGNRKVYSPQTSSSGGYGGHSSGGGHSAGHSSHSAGHSSHSSGGGGGHRF